MRSIRSLFTETKNEIDASHAKRMARRCRYFDMSCFDKIPVINYPKEGTQRFQNDMEEVVRCYNTPSMSTRFLRQSDESVEDVFKTYCKENGYKNIDWKKISDILDDVDSIILKLKYKNNRPRPLHYFDNQDSTQIKYKKSPSFPSGHTTIAYFLCDVLSSYIPEIKNDLQTLAGLIGQTRLENAVHFPTDVEYGRLIGETLASIFLDNDNTTGEIEGGLKNKHYKKFAKKMNEKAFDIYGENDCQKNFAHDIADFLHRTNQIEFYNLSYDECFNAAKHLMAGLPSEFITENPHIKSQIDGLVMANVCIPIDNNYKVNKIHKCFHPNVLERGAPGEFRNFSHSSRASVSYPEPNKIDGYLKATHNFLDNPWIRHLLYEYVHPFCDGNGRSGRIVMAADCDFDFSKVNQMISSDYIKNIIAHMQPDKMEKLLKM